MAVERNTFSDTEHERFLSVGLRIGSEPEPTDDAASEVRPEHGVDHRHRMTNCGIQIVGGDDHPITEVDASSDSRTNVTVKFKVPEDTPNGKYSGKVVLMTLPKEGEMGEQEVAVRLRVDREVSIEVTDEEIIELESAIIPLKYQINKDISRGSTDKRGW